MNTLLIGMSAWFAYSAVTTCFEPFKSGFSKDTIAIFTVKVAALAITLGGFYLAGLVIIFLGGIL